MAVVEAPCSPAKCMVELEKGRKRRWMKDDMVIPPRKRSARRYLFSIVDDGQREIVRRVVVVGRVL